MKISEIVQKMSLEERVALCSGKNNWETKPFKKYNIPAIMVSDGPHGLRKQENASDILGLNKSVPATCFPTAVSTACSFDPELLGKLGETLAVEAGANGVSVVLGPGVNIKRNPLCGRNFEYFSEDPIVAGKLGAAYISEAQKTGIGTSLKHFACNNQEYFRLASDSQIDNRTFHELYLTPFEIAVKEGKPATVMCSYNKINGKYSSENGELLNDILREDWGYKGLVVSDWTAQGDRIKGFKSGMDLAMPGGSAYGETDTVKAVRSGELSAECVNKSAERVAKLAIKGARALRRDFSFSKDEHHEIARKIAEESAVLLKNENGILPLSGFSGIGLFGYMAKEPRYQGYGSSRIVPTKLLSVTDILKKVPFAKGYNKYGKTTDELINEAVELAKNVETAVIFAGLNGEDEAEGLDRTTMAMPEGHNRLIEAVAEVNPNTVVVLFSGSVIETPWADSVKAILYMGLPGQAGAEAVINLLSGKANPCGKLAETWPFEYSDVPSAGYYSNGNRDAEYREGIYVGYRYYEKAGVPVRFAFGSGLSYTTFEYKNLKVVGCNVYVTVKNTGNVPGKEIVELYVSKKDSAVHRPVKELKDFAKVYIRPGEEKTVKLTLSEYSFRVYYGGEFVVEDGEYEITAGPSLSDQPLCRKIRLAGEKIYTYDENSSENPSWYETLSGEPSRRDWIGEMGTLYREPKESGIKLPVTVDTPFIDAMERNRLLYILGKLFDEYNKNKYRSGSIDYKLAIAMFNEACIRSLQTAAGIKGHFAEGVCDIANGKYLESILKFIKR